MDNQDSKILIKDVLKLIKEIGLEEAIKQLYVGRDRMRNFLKENQCEHVRGTTEWLYKGDNPDFLNWNLYDYVHKKGLRGTKPKSKQVNIINNQESKEVNKTDKKEVDNMENNKTNNPVNNNENNQESNNINNQEKKKVTYEIPVSLHDEYRIKAIVERKTVSELVAEAMKQYLQGN